LSLTSVLASLQDDTPADRSLLKKIVLLQDHVNDLKKELAGTKSRHKPDELSEQAVWKDTTNPAKPPDDTQSAGVQTSSETWESFDNVIQVHHPHITWTDEARNVRSRRVIPLYRDCNES
jgi:hypothetical protein